MNVDIEAMAKDHIDKKCIVFADLFCYKDIHLCVDQRASQWIKN